MSGINVIKASVLVSAVLAITQQSSIAATISYNSSTRTVTVRSNYTGFTDKYVARFDGGYLTIIDNTFGGDFEVFSMQSYRVGRIKFYGDADRDEFTNETYISLHAWGRAGNDLLVGGSGRDQLYGQAGEDYLRGGSNNDILNAGMDRVEGEALGGQGNDQLITYLFISGFSFNNQQFRYGQSSNETITRLYIFAP